MSVTVITPPDSIPANQGPTLFLAGPIPGSEDWQSTAVWMISDRWKGPDIIIANPRRPGTFPPEAFADQVAWEHYHLNLALERGLVLFWLVRQTAPMDFDRTYAQTSRYELGYVVGQLRRSLNWGMAGSCPLAVGVDPRFHGANYIQTVLNSEFQGKVVVHRTLGDAVDSALSTLSVMLSEP